MEYTLDTRLIEREELRRLEIRQFLQAEGQRASYTVYFTAEDQRPSERTIATKAGEGGAGYLDPGLHLARSSRADLADGLAG